MESQKALNNALAGGVQATLVTIVGYPFDLVKTRMQAGKYVNSIDCLKKTILKEGFLGIYRGASMPWLSHLVKRPLQFPLAEYMKDNNWSNNYMIGGVSAVTGTIFGTPLQVVKVSIQTSSGQVNKNALSYIRDNFQRNGVVGFYRGFFPTLMKDSVFGASFVGNYYTFRDYLGTDRWYKNFVSGASAHCLTWCLFIPIDYVKTAIQRSETKITISQVVNQTIKSKGVFAFWKGVGPACLRTIPVSGIAMTGYEYVRKILN